MPKCEQARCKGYNEGLDVREGAVSRSADVDRGKEAEDIFGGVGKLPELKSISQVNRT